mmetsp:Transcript_26767/g.53782  ORF Transcript_26767/g.53782 Transcript_26767/m.53782 type:complete len:128 (-) Transcript_26767:151-534(-)
MQFDSLDSDDEGEERARRQPRQRNVTRSAPTKAKPPSQPPSFYVYKTQNSTRIESRRESIMNHVNSDTYTALQEYRARQAQERVAAKKQERMERAIMPTKTLLKRDDFLAKLNEAEKADKHRLAIKA